MKPSNLLTLLLAAAVILLLFISPNFCSPRTTSKIDSLVLANQRLDSLVNLQGQIIYEQETLLTDSKQVMRELTDSIFRLRKKHDKKIKDVIAYYKGSSLTKIDSILIPYADSADLKRKDSLIQGCRKIMQVLVDSFIFVPRHVEKKTDYYRFAGTVLKEGFRIDSLSIPDTLQLRFVEKKGGLFRPPTTHVQFFHSNPLITTTQANSLLYKPPKKKRLLEKALLVGAGILIGSKL